jgi:hypothetical protein
VWEKQHIYSESLEAKITATAYQTHAENLLHARHYDRHWGYRNKKEIPTLKELRFVWQ